MERLTREMTFEEEYTLLQKEAKELFDKEDGKSEPPRSHNIVRRALRCIKKLLAEVEPYKTYEDLEEQGLLLRLPCKVGDTVWDIKYNWVRGSVVTRYDTAQNIGKKYNEHIHIIFNGFHGCFNVEDFGKTVFLTKEEAERALEQRK